MDSYSFNINNNPYEVKIISIKGNLALVEVNGIVYRVDIADIADFELPLVTRSPAGSLPIRQSSQGKAASSSQPKLASPAVDAGPNTITAPMPGQVLKILVEKGKQVQVGDVVVIIEAMKMENEIRANIAGAVADIHVEEGKNVAEGAVLITLKG